MLRLASCACQCSYRASKSNAYSRVLCLQGKRGSMMQRGCEFSLAAALLGWPPAPGYAAPGQQAPDSWREDFLAQADADVWLGLFRSCRSGRDLALRSAPRARLTHDCTATISAETRAAQLRSVKQLLAIRGSQPTTLSVTADHSLEPVSTLLHHILEHPAITGLVFQPYRPSDNSWYPSPADTALMVMTSFPNLTTLSVPALTWRLPPPSHLPTITSLSVQIAEPEFVACFNDGELDERLMSLLGSVAVYVPQLTRIDFGWARCRLDCLVDWQVLFGQQTAAPAAAAQLAQPDQPAGPARPVTFPHLTHFSTDLHCSDTLIGLLVERAPNLKLFDAGEHWACVCAKRVSCGAGASRLSAQQHTNARLCLCCVSCVV